MVIDLLIKDERLKFIKDNKIDVRNSKAKIVIDEHKYDCIFENYTITSNDNPKSFSKIIIDNITLSVKQVEELMKYSKITFHGMQWYVNLELINFKDNDNCKIQKLQFIEY